jgi:hypothetical protein
MKNILIFPHMSFNILDGGITVQYYLAQILSEYGQNVKIYNSSGITPNHIYNNYYNNEFSNDDTVVIYCEGIVGNPLNAKNVVRWMLSELGKNVPYERVHTWGKNELVYYFNSEVKIAQQPEKIGNVYKMLSTIYVNSSIKNINLNPRQGSCHTLRKTYWHSKSINTIHKPESFEITRSHTHDDYIQIFNKYEYFISYDPCTFLTIIAALYGCISIVYKVDGKSKKDWYDSYGTSIYMKHKGIDSLYGVAYGLEEFEYAKSTLHLVKEQWDDIINFNKEHFVKSFINDINNFDKNINTVQNNYFQEYTNVGISLGWNCHSAGYGVSNFIRKTKELGYKTCPFDKMVSNYRGLVECIKDDFAHLCDETFLEQTIICNNEISIYNNKYNFIFNHESPDHANLYITENWTEGTNHFINNNYKNLKERYKNRVNNFVEYLSTNGNIITFIITEWNKCESDLYELTDILKIKYPNLIYKYIILNDPHGKEYLHKHLKYMRFTEDDPEILRLL